MISGAHVVVTSTKPEADHAFLRDVLKLPHVSDGGYLIYGLPPAELSVHEAREETAHELFLHCKDVKAFIAEMKKRKIACTAPEDRG